jgi:hypothetical protein
MTVRAVITALLVIAAAACGPDRNPLARLPAFIAPPADPPKCQPVPSSTDVILPVKGPFTLCKGAFASREAFAVMRDSARRTVWFARIWWVQEFSLELSLNAMSDVVRRPDLELPWWVHFNGQVGAPGGACRRTRA